MKKALLVLFALFLFNPTAHAAIAFDSVMSTVNHDPVTGSVTDSFTNTAGNIVFVGVVHRSGDFVTGVTYAGQTMTQIKKVADGSGFTEEYIYMLANAPTGTNNIVISFSGTNVAIRDSAVSYSGAKTTGQPDNTTSSNGTASSVTSSLTTIADNSWSLLWVWNNAANNTAGTGSTARGTAANPMFFDSNGPVHPAGSYSMSASWGSSSGFGALQISFAPVPTVVAPVIFPKISNWF